MKRIEYLTHIVGALSLLLAAYASWQLLMGGTALGVILGLGFTSVIGMFVLGVLNVYRLKAEALRAPQDVQHNTLGYSELVDTEQVVTMEDTIDEHLKG